MNRREATVRANQRLRDKLADQRSCGQCRACCTTMPVLEIPTSGRDKPAGEPCPHLQAAPAKGCAIYAHRPDGCRTWKCVWLSEPDTLRGDERPDRLGAIFDAKDSAMGFPVVLCREDRVGAFADLAVRSAVARLVGRGNLVLLISGDEGAIVVHDVLGPLDKIDAYREYEERTAAMCHTSNRYLDVVNATMLGDAEF